MKKIGYTAREQYLLAALAMLSFIIYATRTHDHLFGLVTLLCVFTSTYIEQKREEMP